jgi:hypothetical protein
LPDSSAVIAGTTRTLRGSDEQRASGRTTAADVDERPKESHTQEELRDYLHCWTLPGGRLAPEQARALLAWDETPEDERPRLRASLESMRQRGPATSLAPTQRRGHVGWRDRIRALVRR